MLHTVLEPIALAPVQRPAMVKHFGIERIPVPVGIKAFAEAVHESPGENDATQSNTTQHRTHNQSFQRLPLLVRRLGSP